MKNFLHPLMSNNFEKDDLDSVIKLLKKNDPILTQSKNVLKFEKSWSKWLGVKYSVFVNSGSSANMISINILNILKGSGEVIVPSLTWSSDISSVIKNKMKPIFVDINLNNLSMNEDQVFKSFNSKTRAIFLSHIQGFNGLSNKLLDFIKKKKIFLIEDVCESHGASFREKKLGTFGQISNFSFYYAHHMSTIEGGMICTNDKKIYQIARVLRSHGLVREINEKKDKRKFEKKYKDLSKQFIFLYPGYNMRNTEIGGVLGLSQLKKLNRNINLRNKNFNFFLANLDKKKYFTNFKLEGMSNYAFPVILKTKSIKKRNMFEKILIKNRIEFRRGNAGGGNMLRQPFIKELNGPLDKKKFKNVEIVHSFGYYIGNYPSLSKKRILLTCKTLNSIKI